MRNKTTKIALALGMLLLASQAQADQLADIKAAGVVNRHLRRQPAVRLRGRQNPPYRRLRR